MTRKTLLNFMVALTVGTIANLIIYIFDQDRKIMSNKEFMLMSLCSYLLIDNIYHKLKKMDKEEESLSQ